ncbi:MAG TPA: hypothetical protein DCM27_02465 [Rhodospirillaceae bacterium]|nr:hypothetical protein [Rhodospirillaceae bacterium]
MNHLTELGRLSLGSRLKRISDYLITETNTLYKSNSINLEASCFPLLTLLERYGALSIREAEQKLGTSHSYISQKAKTLKELGLIDITADKRDARSKHLHLTQQGLALIEKTRPIWKAIDIAFAKMLGDEERKIFHALAALEEKIMPPMLFQKTVMDQIKNDGANRSSEIQIVEYKPEYKDAFVQLNLEWLEKMFVLQEFDYNVFEDPEQYIIQKGGKIFFALLDNAPIGTVALYPDGNNNFELCKMGVDPRFRSLGIGRKLVQHGIKEAQKAGLEELTLLTNSYKLAPAVRLYRELGFRETPLTTDDIKKYGKGRVDLRMTYPLKTS